MIDAPAVIKKKSKPARIPFRVVEGTLIPADRWAEEELRLKRLKDGDIVYSTINKLRSRKLNRLVHRLGKLCVENIEEFKYTDAHGAIKRLQIEANAACDEIGVLIPGVGTMLYRVPRSISFDSMDEAEFKALGRALSRYISKQYWPALGPEQIELMAESMVD